MADAGRGTLSDAEGRTRANTGTSARDVAIPALVLGAIALASALLLGGALRPEPEPAPPNRVAGVRVERCAGGPLIVRDQDPRVGDGVNGPSALRAPEWLERPLGRYYLYFAHHHGSTIRLATADAPCGPWRVRDPVLALEALPSLKHHVASPDVHVDEARREILMYVHGRTLDGAGQATALAVSSDGLRFEPVGGNIALPYLRRFDWRGEVFGISAGFLRATEAGAGYHLALVRSPDGRGRFSLVKHLLPRIRHTAVMRRDDTLLVFHSRYGDAPERIQVSTLALGDDPHRWRLSAPRDVLRPEAPWEGGDLPMRASRRGRVRRPVPELRDPAILEDEGRTWLFYAIAGESGLAAAELEIELAPEVAAGG